MFNKIATKIENTDEQLVYEWVKTGQWNKSTFMGWLNAVKADSFANGCEYANDEPGKE